MANGNYCYNIVYNFILLYDLFMDIQDELKLLQEKINAAEAHNQPIDEYIERTIVLLQKSLDIFKKNMAEQGRDEMDTIVAQIEIQQFSAMKQLAQKIDLPTDKYDELIKQVQIRIFGEENWENFFGGK